MSSDGPLGRDVLVEVGMSYVEGMMPSIDPKDYDRLSATLTKFLDGKLRFADASRVFIQLTGRDEPLTRVSEITKISDDLIPYNEEEQGDENRNRKKTRTWSAYEDQRLVAGVYKYGLDNWPMVAAFVGNGRTRAQCTQRWARGLNPKICKKHWTPAEDEQLKRLVQAYGEKAWTKIAAALGNRSDVQCRYHYRQLVKGDEIPGTFMALGRQAPLAQSATAFYTSQFRPVISQPMCLVPPMVVQRMDEPPQPVFGPPPIPASALAAPMNPLRVSYNVLPTLLKRPKPESEPVKRPSVPRNTEIDKFLSHFK